MRFTNIQSVLVALFHAGKHTQLDMIKLCVVLHSSFGNAHKNYLKEIRWDDLHWIPPSHDRDKRRVLVHTVRNFQVLYT
jgi:hypothetical protein